MIEHAIIGALAGVVLALRFRVLALLPAMGVAFILVSLSAFANGGDGWSMGLTTIIIATFLQVGYAAVIVAKCFSFVHRAARVTSADFVRSSKGKPRPRTEAWAAHSKSGRYWG
jgi:hypothetical protein